MSQGWDPAASLQGHAARPAAHVGVIVQTAPFPQKPVTQSGNASQHPQRGQGHVSHIWVCLHHWALSSTMSNAVGKTQKWESVRALRCYPRWISSTARRKDCRKEAPGSPTGNGWKQKMFHGPSCLWDVGYCPSLGRIQALCDFPTVSALKQNERKQMIMYSFCILFNSNLTNMITRLRSQTGTLWFQHIHGWYPARQERTIVLCDSKHITCL